MNAKQRVYNRIQGREVDKIPNLNIVMTLAADEINVPYSHYVKDYKKLVEGNIVCAEKYGIDGVCVVSDAYRETDAFGADIVFPEDDVPYCTNHILADSVDISLLADFDVYENERTLDRIKAVELLKKRVDNDYPVIGWIEGVLAESADLRGINNLLLDLAMEEKSLDELFSFVYRKACDFAKAQIDAGADIIGVGNAVASLVGPEYYKKHAYKYDKNLIKFIHDNGAMTKLHICGDTTQLLPHIKELKSDIVDVDYMVNFKRAVETFNGIDTSVSGNMDPVSVFLNGKPNIVAKNIKRLISESDNTTIISGGCEIPKNTPRENLVVMNDLLKIR